MARTMKTGGTQPGKVLRILCFLVMFLVVSAGGSAHAHHYAFYTAVYKALRKSDLESVRELFSKSAWKGEGGGISAEKLQQRLKKRGKLLRLTDYSRYGKPGNKVKRRGRLVVVFQIQGPDKNADPRWVFLFTEHRGGFGEEASGNNHAKAWRILKISEDLDQAEQFLERKFLPERM